MSLPQQNFGMAANRPKLISLNCSEHYVQHWTYKEALRQLFANFSDASLTKYPQATILEFKENQTHIQFTAQSEDEEIIPTNYIRYDKAKKILTLRNQTSFSPQRMLFGASTRRENPVAIGQFGQGMKLALIILLRMGMRVTIQSGSWIYYTTLKDWDLPYNEGKVLYIQIRPRQVPQNEIDTTQVRIENIQKQKFDEFRYLSLAMLDPKSFVTITKGQSQLVISLTDNKIRGQIRKKGVIVNTYTSDIAESYSYNLNKIDLNRQRSAAINQNQLMHQQSELHFNICNDYKKLTQDNPFLVEILRDHLQKVYSMLARVKNETYFFHCYSNQAVADILFQRFRQKEQKEEIYPAIPQEVLKNKIQLKKYGLQDNFYPFAYVSWQQWHTLIKSKHYKTCSKKIQQLLNGHVQEQLTAEEMVIFERIKQAIHVLKPHINEYSFKKKNIQNILCYKSATNERKSIFINVGQMTNNRAKFIDALLQALKV